MGFGLDSRSAMQDGATAGFGNLAAALLMAPQLRRKLDEQAADKKDERAFRDRQLAQALQMHNDSLGLQREELQQRRDQYQGDNTRKWAEDAGAGLNHAWDRANDSLKVALSGRAPKAAPVAKSPAATKEPVYKPSLYKTVENVDENGKTVRTQVLKSPEEIDAERSLFGRAIKGPPAPAPKAPLDPAQVSENQARNRTVQQQQVDAGLVQIPGVKTSPETLAARKKATSAERARQIATGAAAQSDYQDLQRGEPARFLSPNEMKFLDTIPPEWQASFHAATKSGDPWAASEAYNRLHQLMLGGGAQQAPATVPPGPTDAAN